MSLLTVLLSLLYCLLSFLNVVESGRSQVQSLRPSSKKLKTFLVYLFGLKRCPEVVAGFYNFFWTLLSIPTTYSHSPQFTSHSWEPPEKHSIHYFTASKTRKHVLWWNSSWSAEQAAMIGLLIYPPRYKNTHQIPILILYA